MPTDKIKKALLALFVIAIIFAVAAVSISARIKIIDSDLPLLVKAILCG